MISIGTKIKQLGAMVDTVDLDRKSNKFVGDMVEKTDDGKETRHLSENQIKWIDDLWKRFFA